MISSRSLQTRRLALAGAALLLLMRTSGLPARAADPKSVAVDPQAKALLADVVKAYHDLPRYSDEGEVTLATSINGKSQKISLPMHLTLVRPNKVDIDAGQVHMISDGKTLTTAIVPLKKYIETTAPQKVTFETFRSGPIGSILLGGPAGAPMFVLLNLLTGDDANKALADLGGAPRLEADREAGGILCRAIVIGRNEGLDFRLLIDPKSKLLQGLDIIVAPEEISKKLPGSPKVSIETFGWAAGKVSTAAPRAEAFAFAPPQGFTKVESFAAANPGAGKAPADAVSGLVGKPAPDFTLTVLDGPGKTKTLSKADLAGKVVLIDFWATWCGPCLKELPEVQKMIEAYAQDKKDVLIVALSQDREPADLADVRKLVEKTLNAKKVALTGTKVGLIGLDPSNSIGDAFHVEAIPTLVILDARGIVQAAHVGLQTRETLTKELDTLLDGKALLKPKD